MEAQRTFVDGKDYTKGNGALQRGFKIQPHEIAAANYLQ